MIKKWQEIEKIERNIVSKYRWNFFKAFTGKGLKI